MLLARSIFRIDDTLFGNEAPEESLEASQVHKGWQMTGTTFQLYLLIVNLKMHKTYPYKLPKDVDFRSHKKISGCTKKIMKGIGHTCAYASGRKSKANPARGFMFHHVYASHYVSTQITQQCGTILPSRWFLFFTRLHRYNLLINSPLASIISNATIPL